MSITGTYPSFTITNTDPATTTTLTSAGGTQSLVADGIGPTLAVKGITAGTGITLTPGANDITVTNASPDQTVAISSGTGISVTGVYPSFTVTNSSPASSVTLTSAGGSQSLVTDGTGPTLAVKGITAGSGITLTPGANDLTIASSAGPGATSYTGEWFCFASTLGKTAVVIDGNGYGFHRTNNFTQGGSAWVWTGSAATEARLTYQGTGTATYFFIGAAQGELTGGGPNQYGNSYLRKNGVTIAEENATVGSNDLYYHRYLMITTVTNGTTIELVTNAPSLLTMYSHRANFCGFCINRV